LKVILDKTDIEELIKAKYGATEITGFPDDFELIIKVTQLPETKPVHTVNPKDNIVRLPNGSIDAEKSKLTLENRKQTVPGHAMGRARGALPKF